MSVELDDLRSFLTVAQAGGFRAAERAGGHCNKDDRTAFSARV
jgi:hypothetical protein